MIQLLKESDCYGHNWYSQWLIIKHHKVIGDIDQTWIALNHLW